jgi:hypothetical protein
MHIFFENEILKFLLVIYFQIQNNQLCFIYNYRLSVLI